MSHGMGVTDLKLGSHEQTVALLKEIAKRQISSGTPYDPFNVLLIVKAAPEPQNYVPVTLEDLEKIFNMEYHPYLCPICGSTTKAHLCK